MPAYRLYETDGTNHFQSTEVVEAETDAEAMTIANRLLAGRPGELWRGEKMVCRLSRSVDLKV